MKKIILTILLLAFPTVALALPTARYEQHVFPFVDSLYDNGTSTNAWAGVTTDKLCLTADTCRTTWPGTGASGFDFPSVLSWGNATSTTLGFLNGFLSTASSTIDSTLRITGNLTLPALTGLLQGNGSSAVTAITNSSTGGQVLRVTGASTYAWGALDLTDSDAISGALGAANGGTGKTSLGAGVADFLETASAANLRTAVSGTTGSGNLVFATAPTVSGLITDTLDTGQGANELYDMDQNVLTTSNVIFANSTTTNSTSTTFFSTTASSTNLFAKVFTFGSSILSLVGDTITAGANAILDFGGAASLEIPNGTGPTVNAIGEIAYDTTSGQLVLATSTNATSVIFGSATTTLYALSVASTSPDLLSGGIVNFPDDYRAQVVTAVSCHVDAGTSVVINLSDGTNDTNTVTCTTTRARYSLTSNRLIC